MHLIGWDPVEGERYLDFLRFCVWVGGESVEENANLVIRSFLIPFPFIKTLFAWAERVTWIDIQFIRRLLIRRPECLGPALRGEGDGLLRAIIDGNKVENSTLLID